MKARGEAVLVVAVDGGLVLRQQQTEPDGRGHFAVAEMVNNLPRGPLARRGRGVQLLRRDLEQGLGDDAVAVLVAGDELVAFLRLHDVILSFSRCPARSSPGRSPAPGGP